MANQKISLLTTDSAPHRANDYAPTYDASAGGTKKVALFDFGLYPFIAGMSNHSPADATTYYFGAYSSTAPTTNAGNRRIIIPRAGIIVFAWITVINAGTAGTGETSTIYVRKNNTTDASIVSNLTTNGSGTVYASGGSLNISVATGDYVEIKWVTPTWATNPTGLYIEVQLVVE